LVVKTRCTATHEELRTTLLEAAFVGTAGYIFAFRQLSFGLCMLAQECPSFDLNTKTPMEPTPKGQLESSLLLKEPKQSETVNLLRNDYRAHATIKLLPKTWDNSPIN